MPYLSVCVDNGGRTLEPLGSVHTRRRPSRKASGGAGAGGAGGREAERSYPVHNWEKTTHSVLLMGYGVSETDGNYWVAKNTWGDEWGEDGYFRIARGHDDIAFESMALAAVPRYDDEIRNNKDYFNVEPDSMNIRFRHKRGTHAFKMNGDE